jgi:5-methylcytosine-specific restriction endonuclease McrA
MALTKAQREAVKNKYGGKCAYCGCDLPKNWHADHLEPVERKIKYVPGVGMVTTGEMRNPDADNIDNMMPACPPCNIDKHALPLESWRRQVQDSANILIRNSTTYRRAKRFGLVAETGKQIEFYFERKEANSGE